MMPGSLVFDRDRDSQKVMVPCDDGEPSVKTALALLKEAPHKDQEKQARQLKDKFARTSSLGSTF